MWVRKAGDREVDREKIIDKVRQDDRCTSTKTRHRDGSVGYWCVGYWRAVAAEKGQSRDVAGTSTGSGGGSAAGVHTFRIPGRDRAFSYVQVEKGYQHKTPVPEDPVIS